MCRKSRQALGERNPASPLRRRCSISNTSPDTVGILTRAPDRLDIAWKAHVKAEGPRHRDASIVSVSRKDAVAKLERIVGPEY